MKELYSTGVPVPFECQFACRVKKTDCAKIEKALHTAFSPQRVNENREFFRIQVEQAKAILELFHHEDVTDKVTDEIQRAVDVLGTSETPIIALQNEEDIIVLQPKDIYMVRVEEGNTVIYGAKQKYRSRKRLYEIGRQLGKQFMQISRTTLINLSYMDSIEPGFGGTLLLKLKNGCKDYVSRTYLPEFKKYLGL
jgi:DNA-binding LytR/AlgR family response regulator